MKKFIILILLFYLSACSAATYNQKSDFSKTDNSNIETSKISVKYAANFILPVISIVNPALAFSSFIASSNSIHKIISLSSLAYSSKEGNTIAEEALSQAVNKNCKLKNLAENNNLCL